MLPTSAADFIKGMKEAAGVEKLSSPVAFGLSYFIVELSFFAIALPVGYFAWHASTGEWLAPLLLLQDGRSEDKLRLLGLVASYIVLLKTLFPLRLGATLLLTPTTRKVIERLPIELPTLGSGARRRALKQELKDLAKVAASSGGGFQGLDASKRLQMEEIISELSDLCPIDAPARSPVFSGEWECLWTTEKELNFVVQSGLFGLPWERTYQIIDIPSGKLENVIEFASGGYLKVGSTIEPDSNDAEGRRFNFTFEQCAARWRSIEVPLPPVGQGWGDLVYLDENMRIQRDVRGDLLVATKVRE